MSGRERVVVWLATRVPRQIAAGPERVLINALCVLVGLSVLVNTVLVDNPSRLWGKQAALAWSVTMIVGGMAALTGYWRNYSRPIPWATSLERVGYLALFLAALPYGVRLMQVYGLPGVPVGAAFVAISLAKGFRLLMSTASRDQVLRAGEVVDEDAEDTER